MEKKCQVDDRVSFTSDISHGHVPSTGMNKPSSQDQKEPEVPAVSSERVQSTQQTSSRSDLSSEAGHPVNKDPKDPDVSKTEVSQEEPTKTQHHQLKTLSCSSKESGVVVQSNSVDSSVPKENTADKNSCTKQEVSGNSRQDSSPPRAKPVSTADSSNKHQCGFDLNVDTEGNNGASEPIPVVAKVGVPIGLPRKPLQFGGELGWRQSTTPSAFRPTVSRPSFRENVVSEARQSLASQGIDLNIAATMEPELWTDENFMGANAKQGIDLNFNPVIEDITTGKHIRQISETRELLPKTHTPLIPAGAQDVKRPPSSYWVDLSSMPGFNHPQSRPFLVAGPATEQVRMVVPIQQSEIPFLQHGPPSAGVHIERVHSISPTFYPHAILPHGPSVIAAYPGGALHVIDGPPQVLFPAAYATAIRPGGAQNGTNVGFLVPAAATRSALFEERAGLNNPSSTTKRREPDGGWDYSQVNYRPMASWNS